MTVNTLGSDSRIGGDSVATQKSQDSRTVAEWLWPLLSGGVALFAISALFYYHFYLQPAQIEPASFLQHTIVGIYNVFGLAPSVVFFLMVFAWSQIARHGADGWGVPQPWQRWRRVRCAHRVAWRMGCQSIGGWHRLRLQHHPGWTDDVRVADAGNGLVL